MYIQYQGAGGFTRLGSPTLVSGWLALSREKLLVRGLIVKYVSFNKRLEVQTPVASATSVHNVTV